MNANETLKYQTSHNMSPRPTDSRSSKIKTQPAEHTFVQITFDATSGKLPTSGSNRRRKTKLEKQEAARIRQRGSAWAR
ncbi:hypothetical protein PABG_11378 [Paracoccidioides brasiliensis Pb03]|nr:hypothetical protein PABG_11378 [Paracoccidioides brasiliensis Pb03]